MTDRFPLNEQTSTITAKASRAARRYSTAGWESTAMLLAAGLFLLNGILEILQRYTPYLGEPWLLNWLLFLAGVLATIAAFIQLAARLATHSFSLGGSALWSLILGGSVLLVFIAWGVLAGTLGGPAPPRQLLVIALLGTLFGTALLAAIGLKSPGSLRTTGWLLTGFLTTWTVALLILTGVVGSGEANWLAPILNTVSFAVLLGLASLSQAGL